MTVLFSLPNFRVTKSEFDRCIASILLNLGDSDLLVFSNPDWLGLHQDEIGAARNGVNIVLEENRPENGVRVSVRKKDAESSSSGEKPVRADDYWFDFSQPWHRARLMADWSSKPFFSPAEPTNVFRQIAGAQTDEFTYFPYGYTFFSPGLGPLNEFGFRISEPMEAFADRPDNHKLIAVFGGSAAWSFECLHEEMFSHVLERYLNDHLESNGSGVTVSVVNFAQHGFTVLNEMITYLLHVRRLRPDLVVAHNGFNDLLYGMIAEPGLVAADFCYQINHEEIALRLVDQSGYGLTQKDVSKYSVINFPTDVIGAYNRRLAEFESLVEGDGARFLVSLQPFLGSRKLLNVLEQDYVNSFRPYEGQFGEPYSSMEFAYEELIRSRLDKRKENVLDLHSMFNEFSDDEVVFVDFCHTTPDGDEKIARAYCDFIVLKMGALFGL